MVCRRRLSPARRRARKYTAVFLAVFILVTTYFELAVKAQLKDVIIREMKTVAEQSVTMAVDDFLSEHFDVGERMCEIAYNDGAVASITTDPSYVNYVKNYVTAHAQEHIDEFSHHQGVSARLGSFTGLVFLTNVGPDIHFHVDSSQTVSCEFASTFEGAGVNQTVHHITMTVSVELLVYNPYRIAETVSTTSTFEIAQTVIVGAVPSYSGVVTY